ncbi:MarR family transcriptional regulator [Amycolatopsis sp. A133]|uniref:MarR family winged helix-turn-helix transcriptional regulator n=1 Tax=Amycolatopsis sp. A133 TaxID=3064472 RepID=UPI0027F360FD|nr:MarR family transcriptional regulator [Amycolatopsis sp. A133]MDQ7809010.1 MarR family transcriptional regulator [Amycolatopsis sp. A133]
MSPKSNRRAALPPPDASSAIGDLTWLAHRAAAALGDAFNAVSRDAGLADLRDWLVLELISKGAERTQLEIATELGVDKTTLVSILDRMERDGLVVRELSSRDRRVRLPRATAKGIEVKDQVAIARDTAIMRRLSSIPTRDHARFHAMLWSIVQNY